VASSDDPENHLDDEQAAGNLEEGGQPRKAFPVFAVAAMHVNCKIPTEVVDRRRRFGLDIDPDQLTGVGGELPMARPEDCQREGGNANEASEGYPGGGDQATLQGLRPQEGCSDCGCREQKAGTTPNTLNQCLLLGKGARSLVVGDFVEEAAQADDRCYSLCSK
jgi:hypothetical protein